MTKQRRRNKKDIGGGLISKQNMKNNIFPDVIPLTIKTAVKLTTDAEFDAWQV